VINLSAPRLDAFPASLIYLLIRIFNTTLN
jgi:hypothetical protein